MPGNFPVHHRALPLDEYIDFRKANAGGQVQIAQSDYSWLSREEDRLAPFGIAFDRVEKAIVDLDPDRVSDLCVTLIKLVEKKPADVKASREAGEGPVLHGNVISDTIINQIILSLIHSHCDHALPVHPDLLALLYLHSVAPAERQRKMRDPEPLQARIQKASGELVREGKEPSQRAIAKKLNVSPSTISRAIAKHGVHVIAFALAGLFINMALSWELPEFSVSLSRDWESLATAALGVILVACGEILWLRKRNR